MESEFRKIMKEHCSKKDTLIAAISGGADSVALLHLLHTSGYQNVIVAHVDHMIRRTSKKDTELVHDSAQKYDYEFVSIQVDIKKLAATKKIGLEEAGRKVRYDFFDKLKEEYDAKYILTAHHKDDHIETIMQNLIRGTGVQGMGGLRIQNEDILRPLLSAEKQKVYAYCKTHRLKFNEDKTNKDIDYTRNFIRHELIPKCRKLNKSFTDTLNTTSKIFQELQGYLTEESEKYIRRQSSKRYSLEEFRKFPQAMQSEILRNIYLKTHDNLLNLTYNHIQQLLKVINQKKSGKIKEFGKEHFLKTEYYYFSIEKK